MHDLIHATFVKGATAPAQFPDTAVPEVAMIGRSNVGKSSLINQLVRHSGMARVSNTPGKTQEINFFNTNAGFVLVDLPGYGYARVSKDRREQFSVLIRQYLLERTQMALACVLIDSRHDPMTSDLAIIEELELAARPYAIVLTKADKISETQQQRREQQVRDLVAQCKHIEDVIVTSAQTGQGRSNVIGMMKRVTTNAAKAAL